MMDLKMGFEIYPLFSPSFVGRMNGRGLMNFLPLWRTASGSERATFTLSQKAKPYFVLPPCPQGDHLWSWGGRISPSVTRKENMICHVTRYSTCFQAV